MGQIKFVRFTDLPSFPAYVAMQREILPQRSFSALGFLARVLRTGISYIAGGGGIMFSSACCPDCHSRDSS